MQLYWLPSVSIKWTFPRQGHADVRNFLEEMGLREAVVFVFKGQPLGLVVDTVEEREEEPVFTSCSNPIGDFLSQPFPCVVFCFPLCVCDEIVPEQDFSKGPNDVIYPSTIVLKVISTDQDCLIVVVQYKVTVYVGEFVSSERYQFLFLSMAY